MFPIDHEFCSYIREQQRYNPVGKEAVVGGAGWGGRRRGGKCVEEGKKEGLGWGWGREELDPHIFVFQMEETEARLLILVSSVF